MGLGGAGAPSEEVVSTEDCPAVFCPTLSPLPPTTTLLGCGPGESSHLELPPPLAYSQPWASFEVLVEL